MPETFERRLFIARKVISNAVYDLQGPAHRRLLSGQPVVAHHRLQGHGAGHASSATITTTCRTRASRARIALVHQRFATNTFPTWQLAHPYRMVAHNGEINTLRGNVNWMAARQASVDSELFGNDISKLWPISYEGQSDTACFDNALEFLVRGGYSLAARHDDADPGGLGRQPAHERGPARLLRVPRRPHGAVGRPGRRVLHRRPPDRRDARPQRPAPRALSRHRRRPRGARLRDGRAADPGGEDRREVAPAAGQDAAHRPRGGPHRLRRRDQAAARQRPSLQGMAEAHADRAGGPEARAGARVAHGRVAARSPAGLRLHRRKTSSS